MARESTCKTLVIFFVRGEINIENAHQESLYRLQDREFYMQKYHMIS